MGWAMVRQAHHDNPIARLELPSTGLKRRHHELNYSSLNAFSEGVLFAVPDAYPKQLGVGPSGLSFVYVYFLKFVESKNRC